MASIDDVTIEITPLVLLKAYACGIFPMAESAEDNALYWIEPERRGILPLDRVHVPQRLARTIRNGGFEVKIDNDFDAVIEGCA
ncbi:MAG: leucyl/phenylalanyl-tRNA--protein transferase, partial [Methyloceanibacter sp.]|nr:leucyl/phenylalanyl-tRNA--protein transferase [Methyloceanibacter sp.]